MHIESYQGLKSQESPKNNSGLISIGVLCNQFKMPAWSIYNEFLIAQKRS